jgi:branched-subunit amino acid aminotransferase/4-amino-4-deoxychorismate lyase
LSYPDPEGGIWLNGSFRDRSRAEVAVFFRGVQSGVGVFETLAVRDGRPVDLEAHLERLSRSSVALSVPLGEKDALRRATAVIAERIDFGHGWIKIVALRGPGLAVFGAASAPEAEGAIARAVVLPWLRHRRDALAGIKSTSYAGFVRGLEYARERGADEGLWRNDRGHVVEGCTSNVFAVRGRAVWTPGPRDGILEGITRAKALQSARALGLTIHEGKLRLRRLLDAEEAFLTSSTGGVRPLVTVDGHNIGPGAAGRWTIAISAATASLRGIRDSRAAGFSAEGEV